MDLVQTNPSAQALRDGLKKDTEGRLVYKFLESGTIRILRELLRTPTPWTHEMIDELGPEPTTRGVRALLVEYGLLKHVDLHLRRFEKAIVEISDGIKDPVERAAFVQYATWKDLRELRALSGPLSASKAGSRRHELRIIVDLLTWVRAHGETLATLSQGLVDQWMMTAPERYRAELFLRWARKNRLTGDVRLHRAPRAAREIGRLDDAQRARVLSSVLHDDPIPPSTRLAAALILLYAIRPHRIVEIKLSQIRSAPDGMAFIRIGNEELCLPEELGLVAAAVLAAREAPRIMHSVEDYVWLFPGQRPGYPLSSKTLRRRLTQVGVPAAAARKGAIVALASEVHPVVLAELTGIHVRSAILWRDAVAASRRNYAKELLSEYEPAKRPSGT